MYGSFDVVAPIMERTESLGDAVSLDVLLRRLLFGFGVTTGGLDRALLATFGLALLLSLHEAGKGLHFVGGVSWAY